jgi:hypothetical protein
LEDAASNARCGGRCSAAEGVKMSVLCVPDETGKRVARYDDARIRWARPLGAEPENYS